MDLLHLSKLRQDILGKITGRCYSSIVTGNRALLELKNILQWRVSVNFLQEELTVARCSIQLGILIRKLFAFRSDVRNGSVCVPPLRLQGLFNSDYMCRSNTVLDD